MASLRQLAACLGLPANFAVVRDFYGYVTGHPKWLSLLTQARLLQGKHIHLNLIKVGVGSNINQDLDAGLQYMRDTYATVQLGIGRIKRFALPEPNATKHKTLESDDEVVALINEWSVHNDGIDLFLVGTISGTGVGKTWVPGSCDKDDTKDNPAGSTVAVGETFALVSTVPGLTGYTLAHEIGHFLGLDARYTGNHNPDPNNLMAASNPVPIPTVGELDDEQGKVMRGHCSVKAGC